MIDQRIDYAEGLTTKSTMEQFVVSLVEKPVHRRDLMEWSFAAFVQDQYFALLCAKVCIQYPKERSLWRAFYAVFIDPQGKLSLNLDRQGTFAEAIEGSRRTINHWLKKRNDDQDKRVAAMIHLRKVVQAQLALRVDNLKDGMMKIYGERRIGDRTTLGWLGVPAMSTKKNLTDWRRDVRQQLINGDDIYETIELLEDSNFPMRGPVFDMIAFSWKRRPDGWNDPP